MGISIQSNNTNQNKSLGGGIADGIDIKKIKRGRRFRRGTSFGSPKNIGLMGQMGKMKREHKRTKAANLSKKNLEDIDAVLANEMDKTDGSKVLLTRGQAKRAKKKFLDKYRTDKTFTKEDYKDAVELTETLRKKSREAIIPSRASSEESVVSEISNEMPEHEFAGQQGFSGTMGSSLQKDFGEKSKTSPETPKTKKVDAPNNMLSSFYNRIDNLLSKKAKKIGIEEEAKKAKDMDIG